jgi:hypothetical protein
MLDVDTRLDLTVLEELDFPIECSHPQHGLYSACHDDGPAKWFYTYKAPCGYSCVRTVCDKFGRYAPTALDWHCLGCHHYHLGTDVEITVVPLSPKP